MAAVCLRRTQELAGPHVAGHHQVAAGCERAMELGEHDGQHLRRRVVGRVVGQDAAELAVLDR